MNRFLIVQARFYPEISDALLAGAEAALRAAGVAWDSVAVPGALEIPTVIRLAADTGRYDGFVALGCVIRGETTHYETVCQESARGLTLLGIESRLSIGNGILTVENESQALERADPARGNKGGAAAEACLALVALKTRFEAA
ncbi:MAG: 6,7-dimethyl-8-ribityllumazine synthase [Alphaproteobacteria bacterium]|nr:6,7-dimethyl-8-ribityllumazine synthase [Alphaproteobacteria bacterium]